MMNRRLRCTRLRSSSLHYRCRRALPLLGDVNVDDILRETGPVNLIVLAILVLLSVVSWAIILQKTLSYRTIERQTATFLDVFRRSTKFSEVQSVCPSLPASPLVGVFQAGYAELNAQFRITGPGSQSGRGCVASYSQESGSG